ncbi:alpha/beta hydrolase [Gordonia sp. HY285]|uniref:alpha/beta hydrolase n=1 Tax=Gordonia liuliyuniae TaxID=2911517 RepID=UPI001F48F767|nr:alpha/beta hydrolase [Gordonia liuliyuniae]MCF8608919.1 alpha/beta hydrolase [Gordonia liuliyuniae]
MPSVRHALCAFYLAKCRRYEYPGSDEIVAADAVEHRSGERPDPPLRMRDRLETAVRGGMTVHTYRPANARTDARIVYLHGGAYVRDFTREHWHLVAELGDTHGLTVVVPGYQLAPESYWETSRSALIELVADHGGARTILIGDSAGGGLALALAQAVNGAPLVAGLVLIAPWVDLAIDVVHGEVADDPWLDPDALRSAGRLWSGGDDIRRSELSPLYGSPEGLPATLVVQGTRDVLYPGTAAMVAKLEQAGVSTVSITGEGLVHVYPLLPCPEGKQAKRQIHDFVRERLS